MLNFNTLATLLLTLLTVSVKAATVAAGTKDQALGTSIDLDFSEESSYFSTYHTADEVKYGTDNGLELTLAKRFDNPSIKSNFYIQFGRVEAIAQAAPGTGIATTLYLQSEDLDEIDIEWLGGDNYHVQSNYFSKGDTTTYDRGGIHDVSSPTTTFHNYTLDWDENSLEWYIDGTLVRTLSSDNSEGYPQTPMAIFIGVWAAGDSSNAEGTIEWAGGETDYSDAPFSAYFKQLVVTDYSTGTEYEYKDSSGDWTSIESIGGEILGNRDAGDSTTNASSSSASSTSAATSSSSSSTSAATSSSSSSTSAATSSSSTATSSSTSASSASSSSIASSSVLSTSTISSTPSASTLESSSIALSTTTISSEISSSSSLTSFLSGSATDSISSSSDSSSSFSSSTFTTAPFSSSISATSSSSTSSSVSIDTSANSANGQINNDNIFKHLIGSFFGVSLLAFVY